MQDSVYKLTKLEWESITKTLNKDRGPSASPDRTRTTRNRGLAPPHRGSTSGSEGSDGGSGRQD